MKNLLIALTVLACSLSPNCKKSDPQKPIDLSGKWIGEGYQCPAGTYHTEEVSIAHHLETGEVVATKITGDNCVTAGNVTFRGTYNGEDSQFDITFTVGSPAAPNASTVHSYLSVINSKLLKGTSDFVTFKKDFYSDLPDCPCNYFDPKIQQEQAEGAGKWQNCPDASQTFHYGATFEARWAPDKSGEPGQQCTYDQNGALITGGIAAGSPDIVSPGQCGYGPVNDFLANHACWSSHCEHDVMPWRELPCVEYLQKWPADSDACTNAPNTITGIHHMLDMVGDLSCEAVTDLFEIIDRSQLASAELTAYFHGGTKPSNLLDQLIGMRQALNCSSFNCASLDEAIANLQ